MLHPVLAMAIGIVVMMALIIFTKMHAFPSLIISAILIAVLAMPFGSVDSLTACVKTVTTGFGNTMGSIGVVIGFGCIMGIFLEKSGAAKRMALTILKLVGVKNCDVVLGLTGFVQPPDERPAHRKARQGPPRGRDPSGGQPDLPRPLLVRREFRRL
ncbi:MAG: hypothetical protein ACI4PL_06005 [Faecousia sp.]